MMKVEFERLAGIEVTSETYETIIEPMYMATNLSKADFIKTLNLKQLAKKKEHNPILKRMGTRDNSGHCFTPNGCYLWFDWVELVDVNIKTGKFVVKPITKEQAKKLAQEGKDLHLCYDVDFDYTECIDSKTKKPVELRRA